ncbi:MAG: hypothetical protein ACXVEF_26765 [Polyangiales bacterium]
MRTVTSLPFIALLAALCSATGCKPKHASADDDTSKDEEKGKGAKKTDDKKGDDGDKPRIKKGGPFSGVLEGEAKTFKYGKAVAGYSGIHVTLSTEKTDCKSFGAGSDEAYQVEFDLPAGPDQKFFAGHKIGVSAYLNSQRVKLKQTFVQPYQFTVEVEPFALKEGETVKGSADFHMKYEEVKQDTSKKMWEYSGAGSFEVKLCEDWNHFEKLPGLDGEASSGDVSGTFAGEKFSTKTALANVWHDKTNDVDYVESIEFYPTDDVTCSNRWEQYKKSSYFIVRSIGGANNTQKLTGTQQPADPSFSIPKGKGSSATSNTKWFGSNGGRRAWVKFDKLDLKGGGVVSGSVLAANAPDAKPDEKGKISGKFEAKVCASTY